MSKSFWRKALLLVAGVFLSHMAFTSATFSPLLQAQPDLKEKKASQGENVNEQGRYNRSKRDSNWGEKRRKSEEGIRRMLAQAGVGDTDLQDAVLEYVQEDLEARRPLRELGGKLFRALREGDLAEEQLSALVSDYRIAQIEEKKRQERAEKLLDEKIGFSKNPRLEAMLLLSGLIGENSGAMMPPRRSNNERGRMRGAQPGESRESNPTKPKWSEQHNRSSHSDPGSQRMHRTTGDA